MEDMSKKPMRIPESWWPEMEHEVHMPRVEVQVKEQRDDMFRDALVQRIKETGQELIDRAEDMVGPGLDAIVEFHIHVDLSPDVAPCITWETTVLTKRTIERLRSEEPD